MAAVTQLETADELRLVVRQSLQNQLQKLRKARKKHSHSDVLLPLDLVSSTLKDDCDELKSHIESHSKQEASEQSSISEILNSIFGVEARELVFADFQDRHDSQSKLDRSQLKNAFDRFDIILELERQGT